MASAPLNSATHSKTGKILRVALIHGGKIIDEKLVDRRDSVTVGQDAKNTFIVPASDLPSRFAVFENQQGAYSLIFTEKMEGQVRVGASNLDFAALRANGVAKKRGSSYVLPLTDTSKGKVSLGEITLLFQFVSPLPVPAKMEIPADIKGTLWSGMDRVFFTILAASLFLHFMGAAYVALSPRRTDDEVELDTIPDRFAEALQIPPKAAEPEKVKDAPKAEDEKKEEKKEAKKDKTPVDAVQHKAQVEKKVLSRGLLKVLGASGSGGALADVLGGSTGAGDIAAALNGANGVSVADATNVGGPRGAGSGKQAGIGDLGTTGGGNVNLGAKADAHISGRVAAATPEVDSSDVDPAAIARYVKLRIKSITACYERELKRSPTLKGKVSVRFSIMPTGRTGNVEVEENTIGNEAVAACIKTTIRGWVFPFKPASEAPVSYPFVFSPAS